MLDSGLCGSPALFHIRVSVFVYDNVSEHLLTGSFPTAYINNKISC